MPASAALAAEQLASVGRAIPRPEALFT